MTDEDRLAHLIAIGSLPSSASTPTSSEGEITEQDRQAYLTQFMTQETDLPPLEEAPTQPSVPQRQATIGPPPSPTLSEFAPASVGVHSMAAQHPVLANLPWIRAGAAGWDILRNVGAAVGTPLETARTAADGGGVHPIAAYRRELRGGRLEPSVEQERIKQLTNIGLGMIPFSPAPVMGLVKRTIAPVVRAIETSQRPSFGFMQTTAELSKVPEAALSKLPASVRAIYLKTKRGQIAQEARQQRAALGDLSHESKIALNQVHQDTIQELRMATEAAEWNLQDGAYQAALRLKQVDAKPLLRQQSDRYAQLADDAVSQAEKQGIVLVPRQITTALEREFKDDPQAFNLAYQQLQLEGLAQNPAATYGPRQLLTEVDRMGSTIPRSPTEVYSYLDVVKDRTRSALLDAMELAGVHAKWIREAKTNWANWKPVQKRLVRETRLFEQTEIVSDTLVHNLMKHALSDESPNNAAFFDSLKRYLGKDLADPMQPAVAQLTALQRKGVALEAARIAEAERLALHTTGLGRSLVERTGHAAT